ncbi:hypothetical protein BCR34DRAFT_252613 [Clohesyomyces aquaticus]|uniref:Uncharacterized protein n=1 Tax=Clohesyomyces aquaticus TaxID=1231657 RepID=A0A1Y1ZUU8_9PLEO|nr:hypothetical protein BCR34DRAFT_252613 [Clohesyomyces aquaticus]
MQQSITAIPNFQPGDDHLTDLSQVLGREQFFDRPASFEPVQTENETLTIFFPSVPCTKGTPRDLLVRGLALPKRQSRLRLSAETSPESTSASPAHKRSRTPSSLRVAVSGHLWLRIGQRLSTSLTRKGSARPERHSARHERKRRGRGLIALLRSARRSFIGLARLQLQIDCEQITPHPV